MSAHTQAKHPSAVTAGQQAQHQAAQHELEAKKANDLIEAMNIINQLRENMNQILENVAKSNPANSHFLDASRNAGAKTDPQAPAGTDTKKPAGVAGGGEADKASGQDETGVGKEKLFNLTPDQQEFFRKCEHKFYQERVTDINKNINELGGILQHLQPVQMVSFLDYSPFLMEQGDERNLVNGNRFINNYRWITRLQELINSTNLGPYKRFQQTYSERKNPKYRPYMMSLVKKEDLEKSASNILGSSDIKIVSMKKTEHEFVLDIVMPQNFKFVLLLFDNSVEKFQVMPLDRRTSDMYANPNKANPSDEICRFDFEPRSLSNVFQRLEENCLYALLQYKTEQGQLYFRFFLSFLRSYLNLFNAKCVRCQKHLLNCVPPTWRDLKTFEAYHDECRIY